MNKVITSVIQSKKETWVVGLTGVLCALVCMYLYFLSVSVVHVVIRQETVQSIKEEQTRIATLESSYIEAQHQLSSNVATLEGYTVATNKIFLNRSSSLVLNQ